MDKPHGGKSLRTPQERRGELVHTGITRTEDRGRASATVAQEPRVQQRTATALAERDADRRQVERLEREIAGVLLILGSRLTAQNGPTRPAVGGSNEGKDDEATNSTKRTGGILLPR